MIYIKYFTLYKIEELRVTFVYVYEYTKRVVHIIYIIYIYNLEDACLNVQFFTKIHCIVLKFIKKKRKKGKIKGKMLRK